MQTPTLRCTTLLLLSIFIGCAPATPAKPAATQVATAPLQPVALSAASTAPAVLPPELKFSSDSIAAIKTGSKTATVRKGVRSFPNGLIKAVSTNNESMVLTNVVATGKKMSELTEADAKLNGSASLDELKTDLDRDYPGIAPEDVVTVITFRPAPIDPGK
jgi:hypothetical protein